MDCCLDEREHDLDDEQNSCDLHWESFRPGASQ
jgi:hypothetical protein